MVMQHTRRIHIDTARMMGNTTTIDTHNNQPHELLSDMISSGTHSSTERINRFMNSIYVNKPRSVSLFSYNYKQFAERSTIRGICIGTNSRRPGQHKNVVVVSGLPLQDPSLIGVGLYVAAMVARLSPMLSKDVSVIPLAHPKEYEHRWRAPRLGGSNTRGGRDGEVSGWLAQEHENVTIDSLDSCKPLELYITRRNKYFINVAVDLTTEGSSMQYKSNSLSSIAATGKHGTFLMDQSPPSVSFPSKLSASSPFTSTPLIPEPRRESMFSHPSLEAPSLVVELKGTQPLDDEQVVARGEEVIRMVKELLE